MHSPQPSDSWRALPGATEWGAPGVCTHVGSQGEQWFGTEPPPPLPAAVWMRAGEGPRETPLLNFKDPN